MSAPTGPTPAAAPLDAARRRWLAHAAAMAGAGLAGCVLPPTRAIPTTARVLVVGGGWGGATAAKYVRLLSEYRIEVVLVEPAAAFVSCPLSNLVLGGHEALDTLTVPYTGLERAHGVTVVRDTVARIDPAAKTATLASGATLRWDKLVLAPGVDLVWDSVEGLRDAHARGAVLQAWKAGPETLALRRQLESMPEGGVFAIAVPEAPYRCPPGPYERACQVASYLRLHKPRAKVIVLDANPDVTSKPALFKRVWATQYAGIVEYRPQQKVVAVDGATRTAQVELGDDVRADVLNVLPAMRAGALAVQTGLANANARWCHVHWLDFQSTAAADIHVVGDALQIAALMPKSGHMANNHAKVAAAAIVAELGGFAPDPAPMLTNTCYSFVDATRVIHVASVHRYDAAQKTFTVVPGSGGVSPAPSELEGTYAWNWARTAWADALL